MSEHRLDEIVIERPRHGWRISLKKVGGYRKRLDRLTQIATEDGFLKPYLIKPSHRTKGLSDYLSPLRRYLRSQVGKPWNEVYSQLCQKLDTSTMTGQHVLDHLWHYVERHAELIDGIPYHRSCGHYWRSCRLSQHYGDQFYVHPETGILCDAKAVVPKSAPKKEPQDVIPIDQYHQYHKIDEIWYVITFEPFPTSSTVFDVLERSLITPERKGYRKLYAAKKQQCGKREIKLIHQKLNLK